MSKPAKWGVPDKRDIFFYLGTFATLAGFGSVYSLGAGLIAVGAVLLGMVVFSILVSLRGAQPKR